MWFFETVVTYLLGRKYQNRCWVGITETWYTFSELRGFGVPKTVLISGLHDGFVVC